MSLSRRGLLAAGFAAAVAGRAAAGTTTDLAVSCDAAAEPAVIAAGLAFRQKTGVRVRVFPTEQGLLLPQIERQIQNDIIVTQLSTIDQAEREGLVEPGKRVGPWRNRLVIAAAATGQAGVFAVPDASPASDIDGFAILRKLGTTTGKVIGVLDTGAVAWTLVNGGARQGLLHQTEVLADDRLRALIAVPDEAWPPILYGATVTKLARRGDPAAFVAFLADPEGQAVLLAAGLEAVA
ncbi:MAG TPA: molybdenum ABC transporter substrate-binding protein [Acetobacteraceae bacterium]|jgi:molybdate transport system substrate-binding protein|nr:molybdenum ABC transporter substrate-binding protein [Acetobacteraceae bacterium]